MKIELPSAGSRAKKKKFRCHSKWLKPYTDPATGETSCVWKGFDPFRPPQGEKRLPDFEQGYGVTGEAGAAGAQGVPGSVVKNPRSDFGLTVVTLPDEKPKVYCYSLACAKAKGYSYQEGRYLYYYGCTYGPYKDRTDQGIKSRQESCEIDYGASKPYNPPISMRGLGEPDQNTWMIGIVGAMFAAYLLAK